MSDMVAWVEKSVNFHAFNKMIEKKELRDIGTTCTDVKSLTDMRLFLYLQYSMSQQKAA